MPEPTGLASTSATSYDLSLPHSFDLKRLAVLREIARLGSFSAAASALAFTPSAVSQQMAALERDSQAKLFTRTPQGMRLTDAGVALARHSDAIFARLSEASDELQDIANGSVGSLRLGAFTSATSVFVGAAIERLRRAEPGVDLRFMDGEPHESLVRLKERKIDIAVVFSFDHWPMGMDYDGNLLCADKDFAFTKLFDEPLRLVMPKDHPAAGEEAVGFGQIADETMLAGAPWAMDLRYACERANVRLDIDETCVRGIGFEALQTFVHMGRGVTLMPELAAGWLRDGLVMRPLTGAPVRRVQLARLAGTPLSAITEAFVEQLSV